MSPKKTHHLKAVESLRGIAALMTFFFHLVHLTSVPLPAQLTFIRTHCGVGVPLFFTLSGFVLAYGYANRLKLKNEIFIFYLRRFCRIAPLFYVVFLFWVLLHWALGAHLSLRALIVNTTFLFGLFPGLHESIVAAGWTIGVEMLFYLLFPVVILLVPNLFVAILSFLLACCLSTVWYAFLHEANTGTYAYMNLVTHLPFFLAGLGCYYCWQKNNFLPHKSGWLLLIGALVLTWVFCSAAGNGVFSIIETFFSQRYFWALIFGTLILHACFVSNRILEWKLLCWLGKLSFGIYLLHPIVITGLVRTYLIEWLLKMQINPLIIFIMIAAGTLAVVVLLAHLSFKFIEESGIKMGKRLCDYLFCKENRRDMPRDGVASPTFDNKLIESSSYDTPHFISLTANRPLSKIKIAVNAEWSDKFFS